ncbi:hypothetical protein ACJJTC_013858 [Scirpophaga incertulas]
MYTTVHVPFITKCKASDAACLKSSTEAAIPVLAKGLPDFGVEVLDPLHLKEPIDATTPGLKLIIKDFEVHGLKDCKVNTLYRDVANSKLGGKLLCSVTSTGQYDMDGKLLVLTVKGNGKINVVLKKILLTIDVDMGEKVGKDGTKYWDMKRFNHSFELLEKSELEFEGLNTGSNVLDQAANDVISQNSNEIITEIGPPIIKAITVKIVENVRRFFHRVPPSDLALD